MLEVMQDRNLVTVEDYLIDSLIFAVSNATKVSDLQ